MGKVIVESFLLEGADVSYCARNITGQEFSEFKGAPGTSAVGTTVDVSSKDALVEWVKESGERFGRIDCVIANASPMHMEGETKHWFDSFHVDVMGAVNLVEASVPYLEKSPNGSVIIQSSFMGREFYRSPPAAYGPCKAAQLQHVQELSHFLGPKGIRVNAISPGPILCKDGPWEKYMTLMPEWVEEQRQKIPLKRLGNPQEVANTAVFLGSTLSSFVTGTNILVDGGIHVGTQF